MFRTPIVLALTLAVASTGSAQQSATLKSAPTSEAKQASKPAAKQVGKAAATEDEAALRKQAKITEDAAKATALAAVPGAKFKSSELEKEKGKLIWSFDLTIPGKKGIEEVNVDAMTGKVIAKEHESEKTEKAEAKAEKAEKKTNSSPKKP